MSDIGSPIPAAVTPPQELNAHPESRRDVVEEIDAEIDAVEEAVRAAVEAALDAAIEAAEGSSGETVEASTEVATETSSGQAVEVSNETVTEISSGQTVGASTEAVTEISSEQTVEASTETVTEISSELIVEASTEAAIETFSGSSLEVPIETAVEVESTSGNSEPLEVPAATNSAIDNLIGETGNPLQDVPFVTHAEVLFTEEPTAASLAQAAEYDRIALAVDAQQLLNAANGHEVAASDGIEILVRLAQKGEIDPKNVDIIDVTDKFLKLIAAAPKENLRQSGKILFHACVLLRMKAEALLNFTAEDPIGDDFIDFDEEGGMGYDSDQPRQITLKDLERAIVRRSQKRQVRKRQVTLEELIEALREAERIEKSRAERKPPRAVIELAGQHDVDCVDDLLDLAHDEDVETTIVQVELLLARILKLGERIDLMRMVTLMDEHKDWVDAFLASLFLSNAGKIDLYQDEFYGPLFIGLGGSPVSDTVVT